MKHLLLLVALCLAGGLVSTPALAQDGAQSAAQEEAAKKKALDLYDQATTKYNLGEWDEAIRLYKEAYSAYPAPEFLFNIGQAYRQQGDCKNGQFFYRRFLDNKPDAQNREQVEGFIRDLEASCAAKKAGAQKNSTNGGGASSTKGATGAGTGAGPDTSSTGSGQTNSGTQELTTGGGGNVAEIGSGAARGGTAGASSSSLGVEAQAGPRPSLIDVNAAGGMGLVRLGSFETTPQLSVKIGAGYPLALGPIQLDVGAAATFTTLQWENAAADSGTAVLWSVLADARAVYPLAFVDGLAVTGELGVGVLTFSGLSNQAAPVFLAPDLVADGAPTMFNARVAVGVAYRIMPQIAVSLEPLVASFSPTKDGFRDDIDNITRFDFLLGLNYTL